jgi:peroxiredoxin
MINRFIYSAIVLCAVAGAFSAAALQPDQRVENFRLLDHQGGSQELYYFADAKAIVLLTHSTSCDAAADELSAFEKMREQYADKGVEFMLINSDLRDDREAIAASATRHSISAPILMDTTQIIGESLGLVHAGEFLVIDPSQWQLKYRGGNTAAQAIDALVNGEQPATQSSAVEGCAVALPQLAQRDAHQEISYTRDIAPILKDNCVTCHRAGGIGPWAMTGYDMVRGFSPMIREVVRTQRMPPWHADPHYGEFANDRSLSADEIRTLVHWVEAGAPRGDGPDPLDEVQEYPEWALGKPDLIIEIPAEHIPASGVVDYKYKLVENPLTKDVWVRASEIIPGERANLHHVITRFGEIETDGPRAGRLSRRGGGGLSGYVPGAVARVMPENTGTLLPANATLEFQMHYTTNGKAATDVSRMGIYLHKQPPKYAMSGMVLANPRIKIPPYAPNHAEVMARTIDKDVLLYSLLPHAHYRGKASEFVAHYPNGQVETLLSVPRYDFNWQTSYQLATPKLIPAGTRIVHRTWWDNSARNPANPDPAREVPWGRQSWDEMLFGAMSFRELTPEEQAAAAITGGH